MRKTVLALVLLVIAARSAAADPPRDSLHPGNAEVWENPDPQGMSLLIPYRNRTPSGFLYPYPPDLHELDDIGNGWKARGALEAGYFFGGGGEETETRYTKYVDRNDGFMLDGLNLELWRPESGDYLMLRGGSVGRDDQFYDLEASRAGWLRFRGSFSGVPHKYASDATLLWTGGGSDFLGLPKSLVATGNTPAEIAAALADHPEGTIAVQRDRTNLELRARVLPTLSLVAQYGMEDRKGALPSAVGFAYPDYSTSLGGSFEVPQPIDDHTQKASARLEWGGALAQLNLAYNGSFYRNLNQSLTIAQPFLGTGTTQIEQARQALAPDNDWHNLHADFGLSLPLRTRFTTAISWSRSTQNDNLIPPTISSGTIGTINLSDWNNAGSLSTKSAHARVDNLLVDLKVDTNPWRPLRLRAGYRITNFDTLTNYFAFNPATGQFGYIVEDGGHGSVLGQDYTGVFEPGVPGSAWRYRTIPWGETRQTISAGASLAIPWRSSFDFLLEQEDVDRVVSERPQTREQRATVSFNSRPFSWLTARVSYKFTNRDGGDVNYNVYYKYTTAALAGFVPLFPDGNQAHNLNQLVRPDLADLVGQRINGRLVFALGEFSDLSLAARLRNDNYGSGFGLTSDRSRDVEADWNVQPSPIFSANAFVSFEHHDRGMQTIRGFASSSNGDAGGPNFPFSNEWGVKSNGDGVGWGGGFSLHPLQWISLDTRYTFLVFREDENLSFVSDAVLASQDPTHPVPDHLPRLRNRDHTLETSLRIALRKSTALRFFYRYDLSGVDDFHQTGLPTLIGRRLYFGHQDSDYQAGFYGIALQVGFGDGW
ncbi:MAG TPA: MtrB/PioB family outer membrane beta-barrel protein [Myxococcota bacterium]|nr:MtrB/PioB family outer membrane beta-barrel protein [Myxococcota bacterium]